MIFCMIDLETLALTNDAYILSCGAVVMDTAKSLAAQPSNHFTIRLPVNQPGRIIDASTVFWHMNKTSQAAKDDTFNEAKRIINMHSFTDDFIAWYLHYKPETVWSKGADFDIAILDHLFPSVGRKVPWSYKDRRCYRTILEFAMNFPNLAKKILTIFGSTEETKSHTALDDALSQARTLWHIIREFEEAIIDF